MFELTPTDPATYASAAIGLLLAALFATLIAARRATAVDPASALRAE